MIHVPYVLTTGIAQGKFIKIIPPSHAHFLLVGFQLRVKSDSIPLPDIYAILAFALLAVASSAIYTALESANLSSNCSLIVPHQLQKIRMPA